ncbi:MAG: hypothetical protein A2Y66_01795 [Nitrospirae bacterium RBG_13_41_22]|nr:MAG: hypothetical protein A2Y66_01795 [Nitrospirae bacterium RBG_13_41_22]
MSYLGTTYTLPCNLGGFNGNRNKSLIPPIDMIDGTRNLNLHEGVRRKRGGTGHINVSAIDSGSRIYGMFDYLKPAGMQYIVFATSGKIYKNATETIKTGWTASKHVWFSQFAGELYACNGSDLPGKWDGTTWTDLSAVPTDWTTSKPKYMITHGRGNSLRNWAFGCASTPYTLYVSPNNDGDDFSNTNVTTLKIDTGDGYGLVGGTVYTDQLIMFGRKQSYIVDDADTDTTNWGYTQSNWQGGVAHQRLIIPTPNDIICVDENMEIYSVIAAQSYGDYQAASIARPSFIHNWIEDNVRKSYIANFHGVYDRKLRAIKIFVVRTGQTTIDTALVYFIDRGPQNGWMIHDNLVNASGYSASCSAEIYVGAGDYQIYTGDYSGYIWNLETTARYDNALAFNSGFKTTDTDFGNPKYKKRFKRGWIICDPQGTETINVAVYIDGTQIDAPSGAYAAGTTYALGAIVTYGAKIYESLAASNTGHTPSSSPTWWKQHRFSLTVTSGTKEYAFDIGAIGYRIKTDVYNNTVSEDMVIEQELIDYMPLGSKPA